MTKVITAAEAAKLIKDNSTVALTGFGLACVNEEMAISIEDRFKAEGHPNNLTVIHASAVGDRRTKGMSHLAHEGLIKRWIGGHRQRFSATQRPDRRKQMRSLQPSARGHHPTVP